MGVVGVPVCNAGQSAVSDGGGGGNDTYGDFEAAWHIAFSNKLTDLAAAAPSIMGSGSTSNVVKVDGPGGFAYNSSGPETDASAPGAGIDQQ